MYYSVNMNTFYCLMLKTKGIYIIHDIGTSSENLNCPFIDNKCSILKTQKYQRSINTCTYNSGSNYRYDRRYTDK